MKPAVIKATELRVRTREILERVKYRGEHFLVKTFGHPTAIILSVEDYNRMMKRGPSASPGGLKSKSVRAPRKPKHGRS